MYSDAIHSNLKYSSYLVLPYRSSSANPMSPSIKKKIKVTRTIQIILRCIELVGAVGLLGMMILITNVDTLTAWLMRIPVSSTSNLAMLSWING